ncbi:hypothetical protein V7075_28150 [Neobacillus drentensis]|uniref:hypothetical protein n=1 Tax=Neobacillus drentensis TaxID=220684 RepID=UPI002FFEAAC0
MNERVYQLTNTSEFVRLLKRGTSSQALFQDLFSKNQELLASQLKVPTKNDLANVAKVAIQTEEKLDSVEEQLWRISDSAAKMNQEIESMIEVTREVMKVTSRMKLELSEFKKRESRIK